MADNDDHDRKGPFKKFDQLMRALIKIPKHEMEAEQELNDPQEDQNSKQDTDTKGTESCVN